MDVDVPTDFAQDEEEVFLFHRTLNISRTGAFIATDEPFPAESAIEIVFTLAAKEEFDAPTTRIACMAEVAYALTEDRTAEGGRPKGMGVRFVDLQDAEWDLIHEAITSGRVVEGEGPRVEVALADRKKIEQIERFQPELASEVRDFAWDTPGGGQPAADDEAVPDDKLIEEIEERMRTERPGLRVAGPGEKPRTPEAGLEVRRDGTIEAKRAQGDLGLVTTLPDGDDGEKED
jgi:hypothetical protein